jgi:hypothetical protein
MYPYWETIIEPLLVRLRPTCVVEIGSEEGKSTRRLAELCRRLGAVLHAIDPAPKFDVAGWQTEFGGRLIVHRAKSLDALPQIESVDAALVDGDHNWYSVYHELKLIERSSVAAGRPFPLVFCHDIGWPYGRRDLYYDPTSIPAEHRNPYQKKGMRPDSPQLVERGGFNPGLCNATIEHGPRNGVLTAVEDFVRQASEPIDLVQLAGFHGLGILCARRLKESNAELALYVDSVNLTPWMRQYVAQLEAWRVRAELAEREARAALRLAKSRRQ